MTYVRGQAGHNLFARTFPVDNMSRSGGSTVESLSCKPDRGERVQVTEPTSR